MKDNVIENALHGLYSVHGNLIVSGFFWDGDSCNMHFEALPDRYMRISSDETFEAFTETAVIDYSEDYKEYIDRINERYGTAWDAEKRQMYLLFRRNEMSITEALTRLHGAMMLVGALHWHLYT